MFNETPTDDLLAPLAKKLCTDREEAITARKKKGLDGIWKAAREQYSGIDETTGKVDPKAEMMDGPVLLSPIKRYGQEDRSTVFVNITCPYTNAGTARIADILLPTGKMPWDLQPTPISDLEILRGVLAKYPSESQLALEMFPELAAKLAQDEEAQKASIEVAKKYITDWLKESDWLGQVREQIIEAGKVGVGVLKGPFPRRRVISKQVEEFIESLPMLSPDPEVGGLLQSELKNKLMYSPAVECIKVENCFPAPECGRDIQNGKFFFEKVPDVSRRRLEELMEDPTYFAEQIQKCIDEGPKDSHGGKKDKNKSYDLWIRTGDVDLGCLCSDIVAEEPGEAPEEDEPQEQIVFATVVLCNERIIKIAEPMLESKTFPYRMLLWESREDSWDGVGIPERIETPQRGLNAAVRSLMDNMGYSVGPQVLEVEGLIEPAEGDDYKMRPYKKWRVAANLPGVGGLDDPTKALTFLEFPNYLNEIMPVIQYWLKMAEDTTGLPLLLQGQSQQEAVGVNQQLMNNSTTNLRLIVKNWDDKVCRPLIQDFYEWCQLYGPEEARGDATAVAIGSSTLLVKELQMQAMMQLGDRVLQPVYGISPKKWINSFLEGFQIDPAQLALSPEEQAQLEQAANAPDPKLLVAQVQAQVQLAVAEMQKASADLKTALDAQFKNLSIEQARDAVETQAAANITQEAMRQQAAVQQPKEESGAKPPSIPKPAAPRPEPMPEMSVDDALAALGLQ